MRAFLFTCLVVAGPAFSECPAPGDISADLEGLIAEANAAGTEMLGREASGKMWKLWLTAPDEAAQEVLDRGMRARAGYDFAAALSAFERLVAYCPDYAEGYNQRAFVFFLQQDYEAALVDLDKTLALSPNHVGALSGRALTLMNLGRLAEARIQMLEALEVNPWLSERVLLEKGGPLAKQGQDI